jgi:hypothetical protein
MVSDQIATVLTTALVLARGTTSAVLTILVVLTKEKAKQPDQTMAAGIIVPLIMAALCVQAMVAAVATAT